jgi:hypothetical protein
METDPRFVAKVSKCKLFFNYLSYFAVLISMSLLLRTAQLRYGMPLHQGYEIHIYMFYYKKKGVKEVVFKKNSLFSRIFYNMILYNKSLNNTFTKII